MSQSIVHISIIPAGKLLGCAACTTALKKMTDQKCRNGKNGGPSHANTLVTFVMYLCYISTLRNTRMCLVCER